MRPASQRFFIHSCIYLRILIISYLATFLGTNSLSVLICRKAVNQSKRLCQFHFYWLSSCNIHHLLCIQNFLARVVTCSTTNTTSALHIGFQFSNGSILNWLLLSAVHSTTLALNTCHLYYILIRHRVNFALPPSISSPNLV